MNDIFWSIDLPAMIVAALAGFCGGLVGSLLMLKRQAMMADALSHSILPGLALAYIVTGTIGAFAMFMGAFLSCIVAASCIALIHKFSKLDQELSMGIVLTSMFALGVLLLETQIGGRVHLDTEHALYGAIELTNWPEFGNYQTMPQSILTLSIITAMLSVAIIIYSKHLRGLLFDEAYFKLSGHSPFAMNGLILIATACVVVAAFDAVGAILVLALFICPAASVRMFIDNFNQQLVLSAALGMITGITGYYCGAILPLKLGFEHSISAAGAITVLSGVILMLSIIVAPEYGIFAQTKNTAKK